MALWDAGIWDTAKWSTIEATASITLDNITFAATGKDVHDGTLVLTLDDIDVSSTGKLVHNGSVAVTLDDVVFAGSGVIAHNGTLSLTLDDVSVVITGNDVHSGTLALTLDDISFTANGGKVNSGTLALTLDDIAFDAIGLINPPVSFTQTKGGYKAKKKEYQKTTQEIENVVEKAINKVLGIEEESTPITEKEIQPKTLHNTYAEELKHLQLQQQAELLNLTIEQYLEQLEQDDEEIGRAHV